MLQIKKKKVKNNNLEKLFLFRIFEKVGSIIIISLIRIFMGQVLFPYTSEQ